MTDTSETFEFPKPELSGQASCCNTDSPLPAGGVVRLVEEGDGLSWQVQPGQLLRKGYLTADLLLLDDRSVVLCLSLAGGDREFTMTFGLLCHCQARMSVDLRLTDQSVWMVGRQGGWLKALCGGDVIDPAEVERIELKLIRPQADAVDVAIGPLSFSKEQPEELTDPILPAGPLLDIFGQARWRNWGGKTGSQQELVDRLWQQAELAEMDEPHNWGGWKDRSLGGNTGFFRTHHDGRRWWLVDPAGYAFFSAGCDCVRLGSNGAYGGLSDALEWLPEPDDPAWPGVNAPNKAKASVDYLRANWIRAFGCENVEARWQQIVAHMLRQFGFNTVGNWSDTQMASAQGLPYVYPLRPDFPRTKMVFRDFPDVFDESFTRDAADYARQLEPLRDDPAMIGYFLMNEPKWGFAELPPAAGMLYTTDTCRTRHALADWLAQRHRDNSALAAAWDMQVGLNDIRQGVWILPLSSRALDELRVFSTIMIDRLFGQISQACRQVDPNHLNLGARYYVVPPDWALEPMRTFDVFSMNCYDKQPDGEQIAPLSMRLNMPVIIGEWHFGALDVGLPSSGIGHVATQVDRGRAYRAYLEHAASQNWCVGAHWFTLYDQSAIGRFDGENYNIGFMDICHRPYSDLADAARQSHERMYQVAAGTVEPFSDEPDYLERLFF